MPTASDETPEATPDTPEPHETGGGTRWRSFALVAVPGLAAAAVLGGMTTQGLLAASFAVSGDSFKMSADQLVGHGFTQYGEAVTSVDGSSRPIGLSSVTTAELQNLCMSSLWDLPIGEATLVINAGEGTPVEGTDLVIDIEQLRGDAEFGSIEIGRDASTLDKSDRQGPAGGFGLQADTITVSEMEMTTWAVTSGSLRLSGLSLAVKPGAHECF